MLDPVHIILQLEIYPWSKKYVPSFIAVHVFVGLFSKTIQKKKKILSYIVAEYIHITVDFVDYQRELNLFLVGYVALAAVPTAN